MLLDSAVFYSSTWCSGVLSCGWICHHLSILNLLWHKVFIQLNFKNIIDNLVNKIICWHANKNACNFSFTFTAFILKFSERMLLSGDRTSSSRNVISPSQFHSRLSSYLFQTGFNSFHKRRRNVCQANLFDCCECIFTRWVQKLATAAQLLAPIICQWVTWSFSFLKT